MITLKNQGTLSAEVKKIDKQEKQIFAEDTYCNDTNIYHQQLLFLNSFQQV